MADSSFRDKAKAKQFEHVIFIYFKKAKCGNEAIIMSIFASLLGSGVGTLEKTSFCEFCA